MADLFTLPFLVAVAVAFLAGMVRGFTGFGAAMVMTPVFSALYGPAVGVALCLILEIVVALPLLPRAIAMVNWRRIGLILSAAIVGAPIGNFVLTVVAPEPMRWVISAIVLGAVAMLASGWRYHGKPHTSATLTVGVSSGFLNGLSGMAGPPVVFYYLAGKDPATEVRANLTTYFVFVDAAAMMVFVARDLVGWSSFLQGLALAPAVIAGGLLGERLFPLASEVFYRRLAMCLLVAVAVGSVLL
jgi:uncharacterized membrane protein YfcA